MKKELNQDFGIAETVEYLHANKIYDSASIFNLNQRHNGGIRLNLYKDGQLEGGVIFGELECRYLVLYGPLSESSLKVDKMHQGFRNKWPTDDLLNFGTTHYDCVFNPDPWIVAYPHGPINGRGMEEILASMEVHPTDESVADFSVSPTRVFRSGMHYAFMGAMVGAGLGIIAVKDNIVYPIKKKMGLERPEPWG